MSTNSNLIPALLALAISFSHMSCSSPARYEETYNITDLRIVFLDERSLQERWKARTGRGGIQFQPWLNGNLASIKTVKGFYDPVTNTLFCSKWDYDVCGHELHHAALGQFHTPH